MSKWLVEIVGEKSVLESLPINFILSKFNIIVDDGHYFLSSQEFEEANDSEVNREIANKYIILLNGINKLQDSTSDPISFAGISRLDDSGKRKYIVRKTLNIRWKVKGTDVLRSSKSKDNSTPISSKLANAALQNENMQRALSLFISPDLTWDILYKIFEIIESEVGGEIFDFEDITRQEVNRFSQTYNSRQAIGDKSRHPGKNYQPPKNPMTFGEATEMIRTLLSQWLDNEE